MSRPPFLALPDGVRATTVATPRGPLAALAADGAGSGADRSKAPVLLAPGYTGSKEDFIAVLAPIAAAGHHVVALDLRGQFESAGDDDPTWYDVTALAEDLLAVLAAMDQPAHLVGHSFGGLVARAAVLADPARVRSLTLMSSGPAAIPSPADVNVGLLAQVLPVMELEAIWVAKRQIEGQTETDPPPPDIEDWMHRRFVANHPVSMLRIAEQLLTASDATDELAALDLPVLVMYGDRDDVWPPALQAATAERLGARCVALPGLGHSPAADDPDATVPPLLEFWDSVQREGV